MVVLSCVVPQHQVCGLVFHFLRGLPLAECLAVQVNIAAVQPLAVMEPAAGEIQRVRVVIAKEPLRQLHPPDPASLVDPGRDSLGTLDPHIFTRGGPVGDAGVFATAAARGLDPFAIRSAVNNYCIAWLSRFCSPADCKVRTFGSPCGCIGACLCHMNLAQMRLARPTGPPQYTPTPTFCLN